MRLIDADELLNQYPEDEQGEFSFIPVYEVRNNIKRAPTIDPIKHGHWVQLNKKYLYPVKCSVCGGESWRRTFNYCPNCGARLDEVAE